MSKFSYKTRVIKEYKRVIRNGMRMKSRHSGEDVEKVSEKDFMEFLNFSIEALEKQVPKKPTYEATIQECHTCPNCKNVLDRFDKTLYCMFCGQKLSWGD